MAEYNKCKTCGGWGFDNLHRCPPKWECRVKDKFAGDDDWCDTYGYDPEEAAKTFAEDYDCNGGEYSIVTAGEAEIEVRKPDDGFVHLVSISAESRPSYYAREITEPSPTHEESRG